MVPNQRTVLRYPHLPLQTGQTPGNAATSVPVTPSDLAHNPFQNGLLARQKDRPTLGTKFSDLRRKEGLFGAETLEDRLGEVESLHEPNSD